MSTQLLPPSFLFRFTAPCRQTAKKWTAAGIELGEEYRLPLFTELDDVPQRMAMRLAWSEAGLFFSATVSGKKQPPWCRESRLEESDGLYLWVDTRDTHNIHRASRFCHQFVFLPSGAQRGDGPIAEMLAINRARENPKPISAGALYVAHHKAKEGYRLDGHIPAAALTGFEPSEHPRLGFHWALVDREIGEHTFCCPPGLPYKEDPSVWASLDLAGA
ncbi:MAG TPA: hypothetical protein VGJ15_11885 [Pirellulales bacterium]|jgi:hypothetical protein